LGDAGSEQIVPDLIVEARLYVADATDACDVEVTTLTPLVVAVWQWPVIHSVEAGVVTPRPGVEARTADFL
jgi:hypothetical protein